MTLVAAIKIEGVPTMITDMLITDDAPDAAAMFIPMIPNQSQTKLKNRSIVAARSKVIILSQILVVAFTGSVSAGITLFADLERRFKSIPPSAAELEGALHSWNIALNGKGSIVGWLADPTPRCFEWSARPGARVSWVAHAIHGSGADHFERIILRQPDLTGWGNLTKKELSTFIAVTKANRVLSDEMSSQGALSNHYGYCVEIVQWTETTFTFQNKIVSIFFNALVKTDQSVDLAPVTARIYERHERFALIEICHFYLHKGPDGSFAEHTYIEAISAIHDDLADVSIEQKLLNPNSPIYCFNIGCKSEQTGKSGTLLLTVAADEVEIAGSPDKFQINLRNAKDYIDQIRQTFG